jgi:UDP-hydrolysing UDP-N-acetyl-D-glucosamine 2-epimerase
VPSTARARPLAPIRRIAVVTGSRADYGGLAPVMRRMQTEPGIALQTVVAGMHLSRAHGSTVRFVEGDGFEIRARVPMPAPRDTAAGMAQAIARGTAGFARALERLAPHAVLVLGDRVEALAAATAAFTMRIPVFHLHGGERSDGALDDAWRHCISRMASFHLVSARAHARRLIRMGEPRDRVFVVGAPALDRLVSHVPLPVDELSERLSIEIEEGFLLMTYHPVTRAPDGGLADLEELLAALDRVPAPVIVTCPNTDAGSRGILARLARFARRHRTFHLFTSVGQETYSSLMAHAGAMVGNSSSGIIEAPTLGLPVVNVGDRQAGRTRGSNVIDAPADRHAIAVALRRVLGDPDLRRRLRLAPNPYGDGRAVERVVRLLASAELGDTAVRKAVTY